MKVGRCPGQVVAAPQLVAIGGDGKSPCLYPPTWRVVLPTPEQTSVLGGELPLQRQDVLAGL